MNASEGTRTESVERSYAGTTATLNQARRDLAELLVAHQLAHVVGDAQLIVSELTSNAVDASPGQPYRVAVAIGIGELIIAVSNMSSGDVPASADWKPDDVLAARGRGLSIVDALSSSVDVRSAGGEITVTAHVTVTPR